MPESPLLHRPDDDVPRLLLKAADAAKALAISERTLWTLTNTGEITPIKIGRSVRYPVDELRAFIERQRPDYR